MKSMASIKEFMNKCSELEEKMEREHELAYIMQKRYKPETECRYEHPQYDQKEVYDMWGGGPKGRDSLITVEVRSLFDCMELFFNIDSVHEFDHRNENCLCLMYPLLNQMIDEEDRSDPKIQSILKFDTESSSMTIQDKELQAVENLLSDPKFEFLGVFFVHFLDFCESLKYYSEIVLGNNHDVIAVRDYLYDTKNYVEEWPNMLVYSVNESFRMILYNFWSLLSLTLPQKDIVKDLSYCGNVNQWKYKKIFDVGSRQIAIPNPYGNHKGDTVRILDRIHAKLESNGGTFKIDNRNINSASYKKYSSVLAKNETWCSVLKDLNYYLQTIIHDQNWDIAYPWENDIPWALGKNYFERCRKLTIVTELKEKEEEIIKIYDEFGDRTEFNGYLAEWIAQNTRGPTLNYHLEKGVASTKHVSVMLKRLHKLI